MKEHTPLQLLVQEGVQVVGVWEEEGNIVLQVEVQPETICPLCGKGKLHGHGRLRERRVHHQFLSGKWMLLSFTPRRFRCTHCQRTTTLRPPSLRPWARFTKEAIHQVLATTWRMSFVAAAHLFSLTPGRVLRLLARHVPLDFPWKGGEGEVILTMDELSFRGKDLVCVLGTLVPERRVLQILKDDRKETLKRCLEDLKGKGMKVQACVVDMRETFRKVVQEVFPEAELILDPFHLIQDANRRLDEARKIEQEGRRKPIPRLPLLKGRENLTPGQREVLEDIARKYPALFELYLLKEDLRSIARMEKRGEAEKALSRWCINAEHAKNLEGRIWAKTIRSWRKEILNLVAYTERGCRVTNGYLEGKNNLMKMLKRVSFGFRNRVHFIKKMLLGCCSQELIPQLLT